MDDPMLRINDTIDPDRGLRSHESEVLGTDRYKDPQTDLGT